jgi:glycosyltransferase involved in cell wall biosynthesis
VAVPGIFAAEVKGVPTALEAVRRLRERGYACRVLRLSVLPLDDEERRLLEPDRYLCGVHPAEVAKALRGCDLLFLPSREQEGFGLPLLEAMASKVPAVASRIPSTMEIGNLGGGGGGGPSLAPPGDVRAFAEAAEALLSNPAAWREARRRGWETAQRYRPEKVAPRLDEGVRWAIRSKETER